MQGAEGRDNGGDGAAGVRGLVLAPNGEGPLVAIDPNMPWARWPQPVPRPTTGAQMRMAVDDEIMPSGGQRLVIVDADGIVGYPTDGGLRDLSTRVGFPLEFVQKLSLDLQAEIINQRLDGEGNMPFTLITQPYMVAAPVGGAVVPHPDGLSIIANISPGWRGMLSHPEVAQTAFNLTSSVYNEVTVSIAKMMDSGMELRLRTDFTSEISPGGRSVGDVVCIGLQILHRYGMELIISLYVERLTCLNGMTTTRSAFEWKARSLGNAQAQIEWMAVGIVNALMAFEEVVDRCRRMNAAPLTGDLEQVLIERARAMRLPRTHDAQLLAAWRQEPIPNEWGMLNALTRFATHGDGLSDSQRHRMMATAGQWAESFDIVSARLPRPLAEMVGATITED